MASACVNYLTIGLLPGEGGQGRQVEAAHPHEAYRWSETESFAYLLHSWSLEESRGDVRWV